MDNKPIQTICLIDDDKVLQFVFKEIIKMYNIAEHTLVFSDGSEAWEFCQETKHDVEKLPDLVLLDLNMPQMDGWDFLEVYKTIQADLSKKIVIYIMSSSTHPDDKAKAETYPEVSGYLVKPFDEEKIMQVIQKEFS